MLTGPALEVDPKAASPFAQFLARTLSNLVPKFAVPWERGPARKFPLSHDDKLNEAFHSDPLVYHGYLPAAAQLVSELLLTCAGALQGTASEVGSRDADRDREGPG